MINGLKDTLEDINRRKYDDEENNREVFVFKNESKTFEKIKSKEIKLGDIVKVILFVNKVFEDENFPADLILIQSKDLLNSKIINTSDEDIGICYIETKELDGEITLKYKEAPKELSQMFQKEDDFSELKGIIKSSQPNEILHDFNAVYYPQESTIDPIQIECKSFLLRGCRLKQTKCIYGLAVYIGDDTKIVKNFPILTHKVASTESKLKLHLIVLFFIDLFLCLSRTIMTMIYDKYFNTKFILFLYNYNEKLVSEYFLDFLRFIIFLTEIIPISLLLNLEIVKYIQVDYLLIPRVCLFLVM